MKPDLAVPERDAAFTGSATYNDRIEKGRNTVNTDQCYAARLCLAQIGETLLSSALDTTFGTLGLPLDVIAKCAARARALRAPGGCACGAAPCWRAAACAAHACTPPRAALLAAAGRAGPRPSCRQPDLADALSTPTPSPPYRKYPHEKFDFYVRDTETYEVYGAAMQMRSRYGASVLGGKRRKTPALRAAALARAEQRPASFKEQHDAYATNCLAVLFDGSKLLCAPGAKITAELDARAAGGWGTSCRGPVRGARAPDPASRRPRLLGAAPIGCLPAAR